MDSHKFVNVAGPTDAQDVATKSYVDAINKVTGDLYLGVGSDAVRHLGCTDLTPGKGFALALGNLQKWLYFTIVTPPKMQTPVTLETIHGFLVQAAAQNVCRLGTTNVKIHKDISMTSYHLTFFPEPRDGQDAATKNYMDTLLTCNIYTGSIETSSPQLIWQSVSLNAACKLHISSLFENTTDMIYLNSGFWRLSLFSKTTNQEAKIELATTVHKTVLSLITGFIKNQFELKLQHGIIMMLVI